MMMVERSSKSGTLWLALVLCLCPLVGCASTKGDERGPVATEVTAASDRILWMVTLMALEKTGFPPGSELDPSTMVATSGWNMSLAPFKGDGYREQAVVELDRLGDKRYLIDIRVKRERNDSLTYPLDPTVAEWAREGDNIDRARLVLQHIRSVLGDDMEVGRRRSGTFTEQ